jgi:anti-anti-sigma regulatory factor
LAAALERDALLESLHAQQRTVLAAYERERMLALTVRELGSPVLPILPGVLLVPLIGMIDEERSRQVIDVILAAVSSQRATTVVLDITGVPVVDTLVAHALIELARTTRLLGAQVLLVGIRPEIAEHIVGLGINLKQLTTYPSLASALITLSRKTL